MRHASPAVGFDADKEYRAIESALLETARGRWFLAEHGRRARRLDGAMLEEAIRRLQMSIRQPPALLGQLRSELEELQTFVEDTRAQILARPALPSPAAIAEGAPRSAVGEIMKAAEDMHEAAWSLQSNALDPERCELIARNAAIVYALSRKQAMDSQRSLELAEALEVAMIRLSALRDRVYQELQVDEGGDPPALIEG